MIVRNANQTTPYKRIVYLLAALSIIICAGCGADQKKAFGIGSIQSYLDIPGVTQQEIKQIEDVKERRESFSYGLYYSTEAFIMPDDTFAGFGADFSALISKLFGIEFVGVFLGQEEMAYGMNSLEIDFFGEITPGSEGNRILYMSHPIAQRTLSIFTLANRIDEIKTAANVSGLKLGFWEGSAIAGLVGEFYPDLKFESISVKSAADTAAALQSGLIDAFVADGVIDPMFEGYDFIRSKRFFPLAFNPVSLSTVNPELEPFISVMNKYISAGGIDELSKLYEKNDNLYARYKFNKSLSDEEREWLDSQKGKPIKIGLDSDYYPVVFFNNSDNEFQGISCDFLKEIGDLTGLEFEVVNDDGTPLPTLLGLLNEGKVSMIPHLLYTPERNYDFITGAISFAPAHYAFISKLDYPNLAIHQLIRSKVGVIGGSAVEDRYHKWFPNNDNSISYQTLDEAFKALDKGEIDLVMGNEYTLLMQTNYREKSGYKINILLDAVAEAGFSFNKDEQMLSSVMDKALSLVKTEPIIRNWTNRNFDYSKKLAEDRAFYLTAIASTMFVILVAVAYIVVRLGKFKEMHIAQQNLQTILDTMPVALRILDLSSDDILYANRACLEMYGTPSDYDPADALVTTYMPEYQPDGVLSRDRLAELDRVKEPSSADMVLTKYDGTDFNGRITTTLIEYQGKTVSLGIIEDLTAEMEALRMIETTAQREREANQLKSSFLSNMSHEVRTPMNAIIGLTEIAFHKEHSKESLDTFRKINISAKNLLQIVNDILDLSKIEADKLELYTEEFELEEVLNSALMVVSPRLEGKRVELMLDISLDLPRFMNGDRTRLWQVLKNYLDNAAKYTHDGRIVLSVSEDKDRSSEETIYVAFVVTDTGIGMDEEQLIKAFLPYEQVFNDVQKRYVGTGLGMPISKKICELMGGVLDIGSSPDKGTVVRFTIPFARSTDNNTEKSLLTSNCLSGLNIMVVEDDEFSLSIMESLLETCGAEHTAAHSGEEALEILRNRDKNAKLFDVILLDYMMGGINGLGTAQQIRYGVSRSSKLLMVTAYESLLLKDEMDECGINGVIEKPFVPSRFIQKILVASGLSRPKDTDIIKMRVIFKNTRVLICEDNDINQEVAIGILEELGIDSATADNGKECIELLNSGEKFDLVLMDLHMPVMDGFEASRVIRKNPSFNTIPIISLTADAMTEIVDKCLEAGMNDFLSKPIKIENLTESLLRWLPEDKHV